MNASRRVTPKRIATWGLGAIGLGVALWLLGALAELASDDVANVFYIGALLIGLYLGLALMLVAGIAAVIAVGVNAGRE